MSSDLMGFGGTSRRRRRGLTSGGLFGDGSSGGGGSSYQGRLDAPPVGTHLPEQHIGGLQREFRGLTGILSGILKAPFVIGKDILSGRAMPGGAKSEVFNKDLLLGIGRSFQSTLAEIPELLPGDQFKGIDTPIEKARRGDSSWVEAFVEHAGNVATVMSFGAAAPAVGAARAGGMATRLAKMGDKVGADAAKARAANYTEQARRINRMSGNITTLGARPAVSKGIEIGRRGLDKAAEGQDLTRLESRMQGVARRADFVQGRRDLRKRRDLLQERVAESTDHVFYRSQTNAREVAKGRFKQMGYKLDDQEIDRIINEDVMNRLTGGRQAQQIIDQTKAKGRLPSTRYQLFGLEGDAEIEAHVNRAVEAYPDWKERYATVEGLPEAIAERTAKVAEEGTGVEGIVGRPKGSRTRQRLAELRAAKASAMRDRRNQLIQQLEEFTDDDVRKVVEAKGPYMAPDAPTPTGPAAQELRLIPDSPLPTPPTPPAPVVAPKKLSARQQKMLSQVQVEADARRLLADDPEALRGTRPKDVEAVRATLQAKSQRWAQKNLPEQVTVYSPDKELGDLSTVSLDRGYAKRQAKMRGGSRKINSFTVSREDIVYAADAFPRKLPKEKGPKGEVAKSKWDAEAGPNRPVQTGALVVRRPPPAPDAPDLLGEASEFWDPARSPRATQRRLVQPGQKVRPDADVAAAEKRLATTEGILQDATAPPAPDQPALFDMPAEPKARQPKLPGTSTRRIPVNNPDRIRDEVKVLNAAITREDKAVARNMRKALELDDRLSVRNAEPTMQPFIQRMIDAQSSLLKDVEDGLMNLDDAQEIIAEIPQTMTAARQTLQEMGLPMPQHVREFTESQARVLAGGRNMVPYEQRGRASKGQTVTPGTAKDRTGALRRRPGESLTEGGVTTEAAAWRAAVAEVQGAEIVNNFVDFVKPALKIAQPDERGVLSVPDGWQLYDPIKTPAAIFTEYMGDVTGELEGTALLERVKAKMADSSTTLTRAAGREAHYIIPSGMADALKELVDNGSVIKGNLGMGKMTDNWRAAVLYHSPRWIANNAVGNFMLASLTGATLPGQGNWVAAWKSSRQSDITADDGEVVGQRRFANVPRGLTQSSSFELEGVGNQTRLANWWGARKMRAANENTDNFFRAMVYHHKTKKGARQEAIDADAIHAKVLEGKDLTPEEIKVRDYALGEARTALVDYGNLTPFERNTVRRFVPFYAWQKNILKLTLTLPMDHPARFALLNGVSQWFGGYSREERETMPEWLVPSVEVFNQRVSIRGANPFLDAFSLARPTREGGGILDSVHPGVEVGLRTMLRIPSSPGAERYGPQEVGPSGFTQPRVNPAELVKDVFTSLPQMRLATGDDSAKTELLRFAGAAIRTPEQIQKAMEREQHSRREALLSMLPPPPPKVPKSKSSGSDGLLGGGGGLLGGGGTSNRRRRRRFGATSRAELGNSRLLGG